MNHRRLLASVLSLVLGSAASAQTAAPQVSAREAMWYAPTAEDWAKPCLIRWQRTWEDAVALSRESGRPILICVNMDGEIASEHYAGVRYRQPLTAKLYEPYVTVIASVYRHTPRDYDENGERIPCPRFGTVTCGEHIVIEPLLFERYFEGKRVSPRHIKIELDQSESYDVYYANDTDSVFEAIRSGAEGLPPIVADRGDRTIEERVASRDSEDREALEREYRKGDREVRRRILRAAADRVQDLSQTDLLRLALFGDDAEAARFAFDLLVDGLDEDSIDLAAEVLKLPLGPEERERLVAAAERLGETSRRARVLATIQRGLGSATDPESPLPTAVSPPPVLEEAARESRLEYRAAVAAADSSNPEARIELAEAFLTQALGVLDSPKHAELLFLDARKIAQEASVMGAPPGRVLAVLAICAQRLGNREEALELAGSALAELPADLADASSLELLTLVAEGRRRAIVDAVRRDRDWPSECLTQATSAFESLARHPLGTEQHLLSYHDFLAWLGATARAERVLEAALRRFPDSWELHDRLRARLLAARRIDGLDGLEGVYRRMMEAENASPNLPWFAGYAALVVAEFHRRQGEADAALAAYERAVALYDRATSSNPANRESSDHYAAIALAGRARVAYEQGRDEATLEALLAAFARRPEAAGALDGLGLSAVATANTLRSRLAAADRNELVSRLDEALAALPPVAFEPPFFERQGRTPPSPDAERFRRRRGEAR